MNIMQNTSTKKFGRDFLIMVAGQIISLFGNSILRFALSMSVLDMTGSAAAFAGISALSMLPTILLSPFGGILADRVSRRNIMVALDFSTAALIGAFTLLFRFTPSLTAIAAVMILLSVIQSFYQPSVQSSIPSLVGEESLMAANGIVVQVNALASLLGPILGGLLYGFFGIFPILYASGICFFLSAVMECFLHIPFVKQARTGGVLHTMKLDFGEAMRFLTREQKPVLHLLFLVAGINLFLSSMVVIGLPYLLKIFLGLSNQMYGFAEGAMGVGSILGGLLAGVVAKKVEFHRSHILLLASAVSLLPLGFAMVTDQAPLVSYGVALFSILLVMCFATLFSVFAQTVMQKLAPAHLLGKLSSVVTVICMCAFPVGQALYGLLFDWAGSLSYLVVLLAAVAAAVIGVLAKSALGKIRQNPEQPEDVETGTVLAEEEAAT